MFRFNYSLFLLFLFLGHSSFLYSNNIEISNRFELTGLYSINNIFKFSITDKITQKSAWLEIGNDDNGFVIVDYKANKNAIVVNIDNENYLIPIGRVSFDPNALKNEFVEYKNSLNHQSSHNSVNQTASSEIKNDVTTNLNNAKIKIISTNVGSEEKRLIIRSDNSVNKFATLTIDQKENSEGEINGVASDSVFISDGKIAANIDSRYVGAKSIKRVNRVHNPDKFAEIGAHRSSISK